MPNPNDPVNQEQEQGLAPNEPTIEQKRQAKMPSTKEKPHTQVINEMLTHKTPTGYEPESREDVSPANAPELLPQDKQKKTSAK